VQSLGAVYLFEITLASGKVVPFTIDAKHARGEVFTGTPADTPDMIMKMGEDTFIKIFTGELSARAALMWDQLHYVGSMNQAL
jgi:putative sterol carrier protein